MTLSNSIFAVSGKASFLDARNDMSNLFACDNNMRPHAGILTVSRNDSSNGNLVLGMKNKMAVQVLPFQAVLNRLGALLIMNDGIVEVPIEVAPTSNQRIDVVYLKQNESRQPMSDGSDGPVIGVVKGSPALSPSVPLIPDGAIELAQIKIPSTATTTMSSGVVITQSYPFAAVRGEELKFRSISEINDFNAADGVKALNVSDGKLYLRDEGSWVSLTPDEPEFGVVKNFKLDIFNCEYVKTSENSALLYIESDGQMVNQTKRKLGTLPIDDTILVKSSASAVNSISGYEGEYIRDANLNFLVDTDKTLWSFGTTNTWTSTIKPAATLSLAIK